MSGSQPQNPSAGQNQPQAGLPGYPASGGPGHYPQGPPAPMHGYAPYAYQATPQTTNGLAIASMVLGILWIYWVGSILALIFGYVARKQIRERNQAGGNMTGGGMAMAGIVLGWIGVGVLALTLLLGVVAAGSSSNSGY